MTAHLQRGSIFSLESKRWKWDGKSFWIDLVVGLFLGNRNAREPGSAFVGGVDNIVGIGARDILRHKTDQRRHHVGQNGSAGDFQVGRVVHTNMLILTTYKNVKIRKEFWPPTYT